MDQSKKKKIILFGGSLFVALMFVSSIGGFGSNNSSSTSTTTAPGSSSQYHVQGYVNGTIFGYSQDVYLNTTGLPAAENATVEAILQSMENNGTVTNYITEPYGFYAYLSTITPYQLQALLEGSNSTSNVAVGAQALVTLPATMNLTYYKNKIEIDSPSTPQALALSPLLPANSIVNLFVSAIAVEGSTGFSVYNNGTYQINLQKA